MMLVALFIGWFGHHALVVFASAERAMLKATVTNINTALRHRVLMTFLDKDRNLATDLEDMNPMIDLQTRGELYLMPGESSTVDFASYSYGILHTPDNYLGEYGAEGPDSPDRGVWYYDKDNKELVYLVRNTEYFVSEGVDGNKIRFKVIVDYTDENGDGEYSPDEDEFHSVKFAPSTGYNWRI